jgi:hypothetical protein
MKVFSVKRGTRCFLAREREVCAISDIVASVPRAHVALAKTLMLQTKIDEFKVYTEAELIVDPRYKTSDGPVLYKIMSCAFWGFKRDECIVFFRGQDVEEVQCSK